jgi:hypothetical protein
MFVFFSNEKPNTPPGNYDPSALAADTHCGQGVGLITLIFCYALVTLLTASYIQSKLHG